MNLELISTGIASLDRGLGGGLRPGTLTVVAGQPGRGVTSLLQQIGESIALATRKKGWLYAGGNIERNPADILGRMLHNRDRWIQLPFIVCDSPHLSSAMIERKLIGKAVSCVVIDELVSLAANQPERYDCFSASAPAVARELKHLARKLYVPVLCAARLGGEIDLRKDRHPAMDDLSYGLPLGDAVDTTMILYQEDFGRWYDNEAPAPRKNTNLAEITVKQRRYAEILVRCRWNERLLQFEETLR